MDIDGPLEGKPTPPIFNPGFIVNHQKIDIEVDFANKCIRGITEIEIIPLRRDLKVLRFNARQLSIPDSGIRVNGRAAEFTYDDPYDKVDIPEYIIQDAHHHQPQRERIQPLTESTPVPGELSIDLPKGVRIDDVNPFSEQAPATAKDRALAAVRSSSVLANGGSPVATPRTAEEAGARYASLKVIIPFTLKRFRDGVHWVGIEHGDSRYPHMYTRHSPFAGVASCIFPCLDSPSSRCTWEINVKCGRTLGDALKKPVKSSTAPSLVRKETLGDKPNGVHGHHNGPEYIVELSQEDALLELNVVCAGEITHEKQDEKDPSKKVVSYYCSTPVGPQHVGFAIGPFEQVDLSEFREDEGNDKLGQKAVKVYGYCLPNRADELRNTCETMTFAVDWFSLNFGSYPFSDYKICFLDDQLYDAVPLGAVSFCSSRLLFPEDIIDPLEDVTRTLIHALASQWIGVSIVAEKQTDIWAVVGCSYFMADLCMQKLCGNNDYRFKQKTRSDRLVDLDFQRPSLEALGEWLHIGRFELEFMVLKAPLVLFILDRRLTKLSGSTGIARVISRLLYNASTSIDISDKTITTDGFKRLCEKIGHHKLDAFFNQWVKGAGCPRFHVTQKFNKKKLAVEMTISQKQDTLPTQVKLQKQDFLREFKEESVGVYAGEVQSVFTGPMTIRIHESDGTPYEHIVEIREGVQKIEIPYHTKYKRLKRSRRDKERAGGGGGAPIEITADNHEDVLLYCLGDVLQSKEDMAEWGLVEWDAEMEAKMEQESYEWIRMDADFEWLCELNLNMPSYMYLSQLQQDRDVVAQQDSMLFLAKAPPHPLVSTILVRTLMDRRYFHGIRRMAAESLSKHAAEGHNWIGRRHLEKAFQKMFCYPGSTMPKSNDFTDKMSYLMKLEIPKAMAKVRNNEGKCPPEARQFILDQLRFNDNGNNEFSDYYYICTLMSALADSLIPIKQGGAGEIGISFGDDEDDELKQFTRTAVEEIERYRRMDEWIQSYQNIYTRTAIECKRRLMKAKVIPPNPQELFAYTHDGTMDLVRKAAFDAIADLGYLTNEAMIRYLMNVMSTDASPFLRERLYETLVENLGAIALGEYKRVDESPPEDVDKDMLVVDETDADMEAKKALIARTTSVEGAVKALKEEFQNNEVFKVAIWEAIKSRRINAWEQLNYLEICTIFYHPADNMVLRLPYPRYWKAKHLGKGKIRFRQTEKIRTKPIQKWEPAQPVKPVITIPLPKPNPISLPHKVHSPAPARTPTIKLGTPAPSAPTSAYAPPTMQPPKRPAPSSFAQQPSRTPQQPSRPRKIVKLRLASEKLLKFPKGRSGPPRSSLSSSSRPSPVPSNTRPSPSPSINMSRPSPNPSPGYIGTAVQRDSTPSTPGVGAGGKIRVPLPGAGRHPLPTTPATGTPLASQTPNGTGNAANGLTQKKPSLKLKLSFTKKPAS